MNSPVRVLLVDDHQVVRQGLRSMLSSMPDIRIAAEAASGAEALSVLTRNDVDVVLLDVSLDDVSGLEVLVATRALVSPPRVVMLSVHDDRYSVEQAFARGACGYLLKNVTRSELLSAIRRVHAGERVVSQPLVPLLLVAIEAGASEQAVRLSTEDFELLRMVAAGATNPEIAKRISWSEATVKRRLHRLYALLHVSSRAEAVSVASREGYI